jgi:hypothetical protein
MAEPRAPRLAVLIDADNTSARIASGLFAEIAKIGEASVRRIYGDFSGPRLKGWVDVLAAHAIMAHQNFANTTGKNASDIALVIDAMDLLHSGRFDGFCLVSSDSDFTRLAARIREQGVDVYGFGSTRTRKASARRAAGSSTPRTCCRKPRPPTSRTAGRQARVRLEGGKFSHPAHPHGRRPAGRR